MFPEGGGGLNEVLSCLTAPLMCQFTNFLMQNISETYASQWVVHGLGLCHYDLDPMSSITGQGHKNDIFSCCGE